MLGISEHKLRVSSRQTPGGPIIAYFNIHVLIVHSLYMYSVSVVAAKYDFSDSLCS